MFKYVSFTGTGLVILILSVVAEILGIDLDEKQKTEIANAFMIIFAFAMTVVGQLLREDLKWGLFRKKPLE